MPRRLRTITASRLSAPAGVSTTRVSGTRYSRGASAKRTPPEAGTGTRLAESSRRGGGGGRGGREHIFRPPEPAGGGAPEPLHPGGPPLPDRAHPRGTPPPRV